MGDVDFVGLVVVQDYAGGASALQRPQRLHLGGLLDEPLGPPEGGPEGLGRVVSQQVLVQDQVRVLALVRIRFLALVRVMVLVLDRVLALVRVLVLILVRVMVLVLDWVRVRVMVLILVRVGVGVLIRVMVPFCMPGVVFSHAEMCFLHARKSYSIPITRILIRF